MMLLVSTEKASISIRFDLTSFAGEVQMRKVWEHRNLDNATIFKLRLR